MTQWYPTAMLSAVLLLVAMSVSDEFVLLADDWARPRTGASVVEMPALNAAVAAWKSDQASTLTIVHPGGEQGSLWGREVRDWLVALGLPPSRLALRPGGPRDDAVLLRLASP